MASAFLPLSPSFSNLTAFMAKTDTIDFYTLNIFRAVQYCLVRTFISRANNDSQVLCNFFITGSIGVRQENIITLHLC